MTRRVEMGWARGMWASRERIPDGYAARLENIRLLADGAAVPRRGAALKATLSGSGRHGTRYATSGGRLAELVFQADGAVVDVENGTPAAVGNVSASDTYSTAQAFDRVYVATGGDPSVIYDDNGTLRAGLAGLPTPPAPTLVSVGGAGSQNPAQPGDPHVYGVVHPDIGASGSLYMIPSYGTIFSRYDLATDAWTTSDTLPAMTRPAAADGVAKLGRMSGGKIIYAPSGLDAVYANPSRAATYYYTPPPAGGPSGSWSINKPLATYANYSAYWTHASSIVNTRGWWGDSTYAILYVQQFGTSLPEQGYALCEISEGSTQTEWVIKSWVYRFYNPAAFSGIPRYSHIRLQPLATQSGVFVAFQQNVASGQPNAEVYVYDVSSGVVQRNLARIPITPYDGVSYPGGSSDIFIQRDGTSEVWRYAVATDNWTQVTTGTQQHDDAIVFGFPANTNVYFFQKAGLSFTFKSELLPDSQLPSGVYKYILTWANDFTESQPSSELSVTAADGATITLGLPQPPPSGATYIKLYRTIKGGASFSYRKLITPASTIQTTDTASDDGFLGGSPPGSAGTGAGGVQPTGATCVTFHDGRTWWGIGSDVTWSRSGAGEIFAATWREAFSANDGDSIVALASLPAGLLVFKRRRVFVYVGDPGEPPANPGGGFQRTLSDGIGAVSPRAVATIGPHAYFVGADATGATRGVWRTDGVSAPSLVSVPVEALIPADLANASVYAHGGRLYCCLDGTGWLVYDATYDRWESILTAEAQRTAAPSAGAWVAGYPVSDTGRLAALAGNRVVHLGDNALPASPMDPAAVRIGPQTGDAWEEDMLAVRFIVRHARAWYLYWRTDAAGGFYDRATAPAPADPLLNPVAIELPNATAETVSTMRKAPASCYGRRIFIEALEHFGADDAVLESVTMDVEAMGRRRSAP